jgi:glycosyltransferase involved in cell wall biosynthesis
MHILYITPSYYPNIGGVEYVVKSVAERLVKIGHEITVITGETEIDKPREEEINSVKIIRWPVWSLGEAYHYPRRRNDLRRLLREIVRDVDVVHIHSVHSIFTVFSGLSIVKEVVDVKIVLSPHYHGSGHTVLRSFLWIFWRNWVSKLFNKAEIIHAVSRREASMIKSHYPGTSRKIIVISNGVEEDVLRYRWSGYDSDYMMYAGRVERYKRLELAIEIARELGLRLMIVGKGSYKDKLTKYTEKRYKGSVVFIDPQPRETYLKMLSEARYAINPSRHEAYSIFIAEALAIGTPSIITKEIADNIEAETKSFDKELVITEKAPINTWNEIILKYMESLYQ